MATSYPNTDQTAAKRPAAAACPNGHVLSGMLGNGMALVRRCVR